jgi:hypothetical protein
VKFVKELGTRYNLVTDFLKGEVTGMVTKEMIEERLRQSKPQLAKKYKVEKIGLFGSFAREEQTEDSDVDILVEFTEPVGWEFIDLKDELERLLGRKVDLVTKNALKPLIKDDILREVLYQ